MKKITVLIIAAALLSLLCANALAANGGEKMSITFLSDMEWSKAEIYPEANGGIPARDGNVADEELWIYETYFEKGVCFHANTGKLAYLEVNIENKGFKTFLAYLGTAESELFDVSMASVRFTFKADGEVKYRSEVIRPGEPKLISFDVTGCKVLRIEMDDGGDGISGDWGALGSALFSTEADPDAVLAELYPPKITETETETEPLTETETETETEPETTAAETEKTTDTEKEPETTAEIQREKGFPAAAVIAVCAAAAVIAAVSVITVIIKKGKRK